MKVYFQKLKSILHSNYFIFCFFLFVLWVTFIRNQIGLRTIYTEDDHEIIGVVRTIKHQEKYSTLEVKAKEKIQVFVYQSVDLKIGDTISITGELKRPRRNRMNHLFNYRNYLKSKKVYWMMEARTIEVIKHSDCFLDLIKNRLYHYIETRKEKAYYKTFLLGDQSDLDDSYKHNIRKLGISHLFALSGMHLSIFSVFLMNLLSSFKLSEKKKYFILLFILMCYVLFTLQSPSLLRAFFFLLLNVINKNYHLKYTSLQLFVYLCCFFLLINPFIIYSTSFLYSFVVSFFLLSFKNFIKQKHSVFRVSMVAGIASIPITLATSFEFNLCSIVFNILLSSLFQVFIFPLCILSFLFPLLEPIFSICLYGLEKIFTFMGKYGSWMITFKALPIVVYVLYLILIFLCFEGIQRNNKRYCYILASLFLFHLFLPYLDDQTKVVSLDVGQGDSTLISLAHHKGNILIDTGGTLDHKRCFREIVPYLKSQGITSLDALILTHGDYDHAGDASCLISNIKIKRVIFNSGENNDLELELIDLLNKKDIPYDHDVEQLKIHHQTLYFLNTKKYDNENDNSNVVYFKYYDYQFLFMGDAGKKREKDIMNEYNLSDIDFLKVGHHGSETSSSEDFIHQLKPKHCLISVGENNRYGHPKERVLDTLDPYCDIYRTDINGSIEIKLNKNNYKIRAYNP